MSSPNHVEMKTPPEYVKTSQEKISSLEKDLENHHEKKRFYQKRLSMTTSKSKNISVRNRLAEARSALKLKIIQFEDHIENIEKEIKDLKDEIKESAKKDDTSKNSLADAVKDLENLLPKELPKENLLQEGISLPQTPPNSNEGWTKNIGSSLIKSVDFEATVDQGEWWRCKKCGKFASPVREPLNVEALKEDKPPSVEALKEDKPPLVCYNEWFEESEIGRDVLRVCNGTLFTKEKKMEHVSDNISAEYLDLWNTLKNTEDRKGYKGMVGVSEKEN